MSQETRVPLPAYSINILGNKSEHALIIPGRLPGMNEYTNTCRSNPQKGNRMKQEAQTAIMWQISAQMRGCKFQGPVFLIYRFFERDRRRDKDNVSGFAHKVIQDALVQRGVLEDDGWGYVTGSLDLYEVDKENPHIVVEFIEQEVAPCKDRRAKRSTK